MLQALSCAHCLLCPRMDTLGGGHHVSRARAWGSGRCQRQESDADLTASQPQSRTAPGPIGSQRPRPAQPSSFLRKTIKAQHRPLPGRGLITKQRSGQGTAGLRSCLEKYCLPNARAKTPARQPPPPPPFRAAWPPLTGCAHGHLRITQLPLVTPAFIKSTRMMTTAGWVSTSNRLPCGAGGLQGPKPSKPGPRGGSVSR